MDALQYAGHMDGSSLHRDIYGVFGPRRGVVRSADANGGTEIFGTYTRVWLHNGYGILVLAAEYPDGEPTGWLTLFPIKHVGPGRAEDMFRIIGTDWEPLGFGTRATGRTDADVGDGIDLLAALSELDGHSMAGVV
jgi:hypothetical protein